MLKKGKIGRLLDCAIILLNDTQIILSSINKENGVAVIGGTGCNFYAKNNKKEAWASGLGHILSDEGSAYDIGEKVLRAAVRSFDSRGRKTILEKMVLSKSKIKNIRNLVNVIYANPDKRNIASYAPLAEKAAMKGDMTAKQIIASAAEEHITGIMTVSKKVGLKSFAVALVGGVFKNKYLLSRIRNKMAKTKFFIVKDSSVGAAKIAMKEFYKQK
jgi:N-acetylglucosamine kinase-like BadF-type ATPase